MTLTAIIVEIVGWTGAALILLAYLLLSLGKLTGRSAVYQWMNVVGAAGFTINGWWHGAMPSAVLNVIWAAIGLFALWQIRTRGSASRGESRSPAYRLSGHGPPTDRDGDR